MHDLLKYIKPENKGIINQIGFKSVTINMAFKVSYHLVILKCFSGII